MCNFLLLQDSRMRKWNASDFSPWWWWCRWLQKNNKCKGIQCSFHYWLWCCCCCRPWNISQVSMHSSTHALLQPWISSLHIYRAALQTQSLLSQNQSHMINLTWAFYMQAKCKHPYIISIHTCIRNTLDIIQQFTA